MYVRGTVANPLIHAVLAVATMRGADAAGLAAAAGIPASALADRDGRLPVEMLLAVMDELARATGDAAFGLHLAEMLRRRPDNVLALALASSPTFGEAIR